MPKTSIRGHMLALRRQLSSADCLWRSMKIQEKLLTLPEFAAAETLALYSPILNEVFTEELFHHAQALKKQVVYPRVSEGRIRLWAVDHLEELAPGSFGVLEPTGSQGVEMGDVHLVIVPGVAFDRTGHRLGYGKGFYDRLLQKKSQRAVLVGLCFDFQLVPCLPAEEHDIRMDILITEERTVYALDGE